MQCCLLVFYPQQSFFRNWGHSSQTLPLLCLLSWYTNLNPVLSFQQSSPGVDWDLISRSHFLCLSLRSNSSPIQVWSWDCSNSVTSLGSTSKLSSLAVSTTSAVISYTRVLNLSHLWGLEPTASRLLFWMDVLTSCYESWMFVMASRIVIPFHKVFSLFFPRFIRGLTTCGCHRHMKYIS